MSCAGAPSAAPAVLSPRPSAAPASEMAASSGSSSGEYEWPNGGMLPENFKSWAWRAWDVTKGEVKGVYNSIIEDLSPTKTQGEELSPEDSESLRVDDLTLPRATRREYEQVPDPTPPESEFVMIDWEKEAEIIALT